MGAIYDSLKAFLSDPFKAPIGTMRLAGIVGILIVIVMLWNFVLREIERGVREI